MAKRTFTETLMRDFTRGLGRQGGFRTWKAIEKQVANRVVDPNSKFRKKMQTLSITSTMKGSLKKMYEIIDLFYEEYKIEKTLLQKSFYVDTDIKRIERKLTHLERLVRNENDEFELEDCVNFWNTIKEEVKSKK
jgi:hypothetical protein